MKFVVVVLFLSLVGGSFAQGFFENKERTLLIMKPDGVSRGLIGDVMKRFEDKQYKLVGLKIIMPVRATLEQHYAHVSKEPFFSGLIDFMMSGPIIPMVWEGYNVVANGRKIIGLTDPSASPVGTIRGDFGVHIGQTVVHGAHSLEAARKEIALWFKDSEFVNNTISDCDFD